MVIEMEAAAISGADAYLTIEEAEELLAGVVDASAWQTATEQARQAALLAASDEIDGARRYQGRQYASGQRRQFPRIAEQLPGEPVGRPTVIWDWDADLAAAVVPPAVKLACVHQALSILAGGRDGRLDDRHDGVTSQTAGPVSESYDPARPAPVLCRRAQQLMSRYFLRTGGLI